MKNKNWKYFLASDAFSSTVKVFTNIFLGIYFLKITDWNIPAISGFYIVNFLTYLIAFYVINRYIKTDILKLFRIGIFFNFLKCVSLLILGHTVKDYIIPYAVFFGLSNAFYFMPQQLLIKRVNSTQSMKKYLTTSKIINDSIGIVFPIIFGAIISEGSYQIVFIFLSICSLVSLAMSFYIKNVSTSHYKINLKRLYANLKKNREIELFKQLTLRSVFRSLSSFGVISTIITILTFYVLGSELSLGALKSVVAIMALVVVYIVNQKLPRRTLAKVFVPIAIIQSIIIVVLTCAMMYLKVDSIVAYGLSVGTLLICLYNIVNGFSDPIFELANEMVFYECMCKQDIDEADEVSYVFWFEIITAFSRSLGYFVLFLVSLSGFNFNFICILVVVISFIYILFAYSLRRINSGYLNDLK